MRPSKHITGLLVARAWALQSTCPRRQVGCLLVDEHNGTLSTGFNGSASGEVHCTDHPCPGASVPSGQGLELCEAVHAEINALMTCPDKWRIHTAYCSSSPCIHCVKALMNTSCKRVIFYDEYPHSDAAFLWKRSGREWLHLDMRNYWKWIIA